MCLKHELCHDTRGLWCCPYILKVSASCDNRILENTLRGMDNSPTAAQQYLKYRVIFHHPIVCGFLFFRSLKTRLRHCFKGCYFSMLDAMEEFCGFRCVHGAAKELLKGRAESGDDEGSWEEGRREMDRPVGEVMAEKK